jgi:hypothetical protein
VTGCRAALKARIAADYQCAVAGPPSEESNAGFQLRVDRQRGDEFGALLAEVGLVIGESL